MSQDELAKWTLIVGSKELGPYDLAALKDLHMQGMLNASSMLKAADGTMLQAQDLAGLFAQNNAAGVASLHQDADAGAGLGSGAGAGQDGQAHAASADEEFQVYSSSEKEPGAFADLLTKKNIVIACILVAWAIYASVVLDVYGERQAESKKKLDAIKAQHETYRQIENLDLKTNIDPQQFQRAMQQQAGY